MWIWNGNRLTDNAEQIVISSLALLKVCLLRYSASAVFGWETVPDTVVLLQMLKHGRSGVPLEVGKES